jgi:hypothetical protein
MYVVLDLFGHAEDDDVLNIVEVEALGGNARSHHNIFGAGLKRFDSVLSFFLC